MTRRAKITNIAALFLAALLLGCGDPIQQKRHELCTFVPADQHFDANARVEGRIAIVYKGGNYDPQFDRGCSIDGYSGGYKISRFYFPDEMYALSAEDIDTLIIIEIKKGNFLKTAKYQMTTSGGWMVDVYSGQLSISMISYKTSTLVRNSACEFTNIPDKIQFDNLKSGKQDQSTPNEYVVEPSVTEIRNALKEFSDKVKSE